MKIVRRRAFTEHVVNHHEHQRVIRCTPFADWCPCIVIHFHWYRMAPAEENT